MTMAVAAITWTRFLDRSASSKREIQHDWRELVEHITHAGPYSAKSVCPWIKLARFGEAKSAKGALRHDGNLLEITGVEGDYDGEQVTPEDALARLEASGLRAIVYTSPSHTEQAPRWRVLAPLSRPLAPVERTRLLARINGALGGILTGESFTLSQSYYYGRVAGQDTYRVLCTFDDPEEGVCVDEADSLDAIAVGRPVRESSGQGGSNVIAEAVERLGRRLRTGDGRRDLLKSYIGDKSNRGLSADEVRALVDDLAGRFFDPADPLDWSNVNTLITDICSADASERAEITRTVGGFVERAAAQAAQPAQAEGKAAEGLPLVFAEDISTDTIRIEQLVEDVITRNGLSVMYGESNSGKSFLACDMACHLAAGLPWLGKRTVAGAVLYVAGEGSESIKLRVLAWRQEHGASPALAVVPVAVNLLDARADLARIVAACEGVAARYELPVALIVVDTLARAFGGGNENASEDMGAVITNADRLRQATGAHVMFVHHSGKDAAKGSRGHSSLKAATDTEIEVTGDTETKLHVAKITKQRDLGSRGDEIVTRFRVVEMGRGQWDKPITTCIVEPSDGRPALPKSPRARGNALQEALIELLDAAPARTLKRPDLVAALRDKGFNNSPIYRALKDLAQQQVITEMLNRVHLNGSVQPS